MKILRSVPYIVGGLASLALLAGCSSSGGSSSALGTTAMNNPEQLGMRPSPLLSKSHTYVTVKPFKIHRDHHKSRIAPDTRMRPRLLFVSDPGAGDVYIFTMPALALKGTITGLGQPQGECSDNSGNVWVADTINRELDQYSRAGALLNTLSDPTGLPLSCAVNLSTGDLAVTQIPDGADDGGVLVYPNATYPPTEELHNPSQSTYYFAGYDPSGNLYVSGTDFSGAYMLSEAPAGSTTMSTITISGGTIFFPGMVQWNLVANDLVLGDQFCADEQTSCIYSASVSGSTATITGTTTLMNFEGAPVCDMAQGVVARLARMGAAGGDYEFCSSTPSSVDRWHFPAGGVPTNFNDSVPVVPVGAAISNK